MTLPLALALLIIALAPAATRAHEQANLAKMLRPTPAETAHWDATNREIAARRGRR